MSATDRLQIGAPIAEVAAGRLHAAARASASGSARPVLWLAYAEGTADRARTACAAMVKRFARRSPAKQLLRPLEALDDGAVFEGLSASATTAGGVRTLRAVLDGKPSELVRKRLAEQVVLGIVGCHAAGLVHGDLRPETVLITADGSVKVAGYGLVGAGDLATEDAAAVAYRSPRLRQGKDAPTTADDLYSLGVTCFEVLTLASARALGAARAKLPEWLRDLTCDEGKKRPGGRKLLSALGLTKADTTVKPAPAPADNNNNDDGDGDGSQTAVSLKPHPKKDAGDDADDSNTAMNLDVKDAPDAASAVPVKAKASTAALVLVVVGGPAKGRTHALDGPTVIGRSPAATFTVADPRCSRQHVRVSPDIDGTAVLVDLGSANGALLFRGGGDTGARVEGSAPLVPGDRFLIGDTVLELAVAGAAAKPVPAPAVPTKPSASTRARSRTTSPAKEARAAAKQKEDKGEKATASRKSDKGGDDSDTSVNLDADITVRPKADIGNGAPVAMPTKGGKLDASQVEVRGQRNVLKSAGSKQPRVRLGVLSDDVAQTGGGARLVITVVVIIVGVVLGVLGFALFGGFGDEDAAPPAVEEGDYRTPFNPLRESGGDGDAAGDGDGDSDSGE